MKKKIIVASTNPTKIEAIRRGFERIFPVEEFDIHGVSVASGVSDQPMTDQETLVGAQNRVCEVRKLIPVADYWAGIEGGIDRLEDGMAAFSWVVVQSADMVGKGRSGTFFLPDAIVALINKGIELGEADDIVFNRSNSKMTNGAVGILTNDVIDRAELYAGAVVFALIPFLNPGLYCKGTE